MQCPLFCPPQIMDPSAEYSCWIGEDEFVSIKIQKNYNQIQLLNKGKTLIF